MRGPRHTRAIAVLWVTLVTTAAPMSSAARQDPPPLFTDLVVLGTEDTWFGDATWADFDGDGRRDLLLTGNTASYAFPAPFCQIYLNREDTFVERPDPAGGETPIQVPAIQFHPAFNIGITPIVQRWRSQAAWTDADGDGWVDFAITGRDAFGTVGVDVYVRETNNSSRVRRAGTWSGTELGDLVWGDITGDGRPDLVLSGQDQSGDPALLLYANRLEPGGGGTMLPWSHAIPGLRFGSVDLGDFDADGDLDLLLTGLAEPQAAHTLVYRNDGSGGFTPVDAGLPGLLFARARWIDFEADGDLDIVITGGELGPFLLDGTLFLYRNDGGVFTDVSDELQGAYENDPPSGRYQGDMPVGDMDNDGYADFVVFGVRTPIDADVGRVYRRQAGGGYKKDYKETFSGGYLGGADAVDYDGDGDTDLVLTGEEDGVGHKVRVLRNDGPRPDLGVFNLNERPGPPVSLVALPGIGGSVELRWAAGSDSRTPTTGLTYAVRVGTRPGFSDVVPVAADLATGRRLIPGRGNAGSRLSYTLDGLSTGTYYWAVQAVDQGWAGSAFAVEQVFTITE